MAEMLSHQIRGKTGNLKPISLKRVQIQVISTVMWAKDLYYASIDERTTPCCFLALHLIIVGPRKIQKPLVDLLY